MTPTAALAAVRSLIEDDPDAVGLIDRCSVIGRTEANDGFGGITSTDSTLASDVPCMYEERSSSTVQVAGGPLSYITHELFLIPSSVTRAIKPDYKIVVAARDDMPERTFEQPILMEDTFGPTVHLGAMLKV